VCLGGRGAGDLRPLQSPVDVAAMPQADDYDGEHEVVDLVDDPVNPGSYAVEIRRPRELLAAGWARFVSERVDDGRELGADGRRQALQRAHGAWLDLDPVPSP
jgi:hypothetical protein